MNILTASSVTRLSSPTPVRSVAQSLALIPRQANNTEIISNDYLTSVLFIQQDLSYKDKHWHEACFLCNMCRISLVDKQFGSKTDKIYCGNCYDSQFASRCDGCGEVFRAGECSLNSFSLMVWSEFPIGTSRNHLRIKTDWEQASLSHSFNETRFFRLAFWWWKTFQVEKISPSTSTDYSISLKAMAGSIKSDWIVLT